MARVWQHRSAGRPGTLGSGRVVEFEPEGEIVLYGIGAPLPRMPEPAVSGSDYSRVIHTIYPKTAIKPMLARLLHAAAAVMIEYPYFLREV
ncbi:hypothetical protein [Actinophytocola sp. KF-1]